MKLSGIKSTSCLLLRMLRMKGNQSLNALSVSIKLNPAMVLVSTYTGNIQNMMKIKLCLSVKSVVKSSEVQMI